MGHRVFLAGASGAVGRPLVRLLVAAGHSVVGTTRTEQGAAALRALGAEPAVVDALVWLCAGLLVASGIDYVRRWSHKARELRRTEQSQTREPPGP